MAKSNFKNHHKLIYKNFFTSLLNITGPQQSQPPEEREEGEEDENEVEEEEIGSMETNEAQFDFIGFISDFAHINVLKSYSILLREFSDNSDAVNHCVVKMLHRLSHDLGFVGMLFQASIFKSFSVLLNGPYAKLPRFKELAKFATFVVRQFSNVAKINKKIFVDMLFWKSKNEALAVTGGYDFSAKSKAKSLWSEHQEEELIGLFEKFRDVSHPELDTGDLILGELTSDHTRIQVIKELKRQGLINSAADLKRKGRSRAWAEQEIQELRDAYELHKDSNFPISDIMTTLTGGRGRQAVTNKLLELGLVTDKAELKKKRKEGRRKRKGGSDEEDSEGERLFPDTTGGRRSRGNKSSGSSDGSSDNDSDNSNDDDDDDGNESEDGGQNADDAVQQAACTVGDHVSKLVQQGYQEQIEWIVRNLRNTVEDRDEGVCIPTPIVPLSEENETAMEDESFLVFLRSIGITPPANQQELFWRIPAQFSSADLTAIADGLEVTGSGQAANPDEVQRIVAGVLPGLLSSSSSSVKKSRKSSKSASDKQKRKEEKKRKKMERQKEKEKKKKRVRAKKGDKLADFVKMSNDAREEDQPSEEDNDQGPFVPVIPRIAHGSDTSDSGLDSELEAKEQQRMWLEKKSEKRLSAADRKEALQRMMARRNQKRKRTPGGRRGAGTSDDAHQENANTNSQENDNRPGTTNTNDDDDDNIAAAAEVDVANTSISSMRKKSDAKKRRVQQLESDSDSDTSSLSSLNEGPAEDDEDDENNKSTQKTNLNSSSAKKRALDSDSDSDVPLAIGKRKRQKNNSENEDPDLATGAASVSKTSDQENSDKENKDADSQSQGQLDESLRLHFSTSDEEDGDDDVDKDENGSSNNKDEGETMKESTEQNNKDETQKGLDSEDDEDDHITLKAAVKRRRAAVIDSDDDE
ncbi:timeless-like protein [Elysia marginata]|uniref:Timeless-like protein n=1 Tax=Elysia marginata TaxID=1093978 RepID=A0AAV4IT30_9GAST|nr:timeless-like protein [Elysia marginata]